MSAVDARSGTDTGAPELTWCSAGELARLVAAGTVSAREVVEAHIDRIEAVDERLNAVIARRFDDARAEADAVDAARARGETLGPLAGVPITVKEQFDVEGLATTFGLPTGATSCRRRDGPLVTRLRDAGAIILGKTNVAELLFYQEGDNPLFGRTNNPWDLERTSGGGSGGEGAIIAAGGSPLGLAADIGGSIRTPAHFCGIQGLRPTSGRLTNLDSPPELFFPGMEAVILDPGPMARTVADLELAMRVLAAPGLEKLDPRIAPVAWPDPKARLDRGAADRRLRGRRLLARVAGAAPRGAGGGGDPDERGAIVEPFADPDPEAATRFYFSFLMADGLRWPKNLRGNPVDGRVKMRCGSRMGAGALHGPIASVLGSVGAAAPRERVPLVEEAVGTRVLAPLGGTYRVAQPVHRRDGREAARRDRVPAARGPGDAPRRDLLPLRHPELPDALQRARDAGGLGRGHARARRGGDRPAADPGRGRPRGHQDGGRQRRPARRRAGRGPPLARGRRARRDGGARAGVLKAPRLPVAPARLE